MNLELIQLCILFVFSIFALYFDIKYKIIPNRLNIIFLMIGIISNFYIKNEFLLYVFRDLIFMFILGILFNHFKVFAMGDVKYYLVITGIIGIKNSISILLFMILLSVPIGCVYGIIKEGLTYTFQKIRLNLLHLFITKTSMNQLTKFPLMIASFPATLFWILIHRDGVGQIESFNVVLTKILSFTSYR